jgi:hypothetical protein
MGILWVWAFISASLVSGCAVNQGTVTQGGTPATMAEAATQKAPQVQRVAPYPKEIMDWGWRERVITEDELNSLGGNDPNLSPPVCRQILARLNTKAEFHVLDDVRKKTPLRVPNDFRAYIDWNPLPKQVKSLAQLPKLVLVVKDIPFLGWYEHGRSVGASHVGLGRPGEDTNSGVYRVLEKNADKVSRSYNNDLGQPAWMPWALRIYGTVWIHAGYLTGPYCSHGCVILPVDPAEELFHWTDGQTTVVIVESLAELDSVAERPAALNGK